MGHAHPWPAFFHIFFKVAAVAVYLIVGFFSTSFVINFVLCVLLLSLDFWTVKNVTGRLLVGLRWWEETNDAGDSVWRFESLDAERLKAISTEDSRVFWWALYSTPVVWSLLALVCIFRLNIEYLLIVAIALVLNCTNLWSYFKCSNASMNLSAFARDNYMRFLPYFRLA